MTAPSTTPMPPQLHLSKCSRPITPEFFKPINAGGNRVKPRGCFWTSTYTGDTGSGWVQWCLSEGFHIGEDCESHNPWLLTVSPTARVYEIDNYFDLLELYKRYPLDDLDLYQMQSQYIDWFAVSEDYDGVHLTDAGQWATRMTFPLDLYGWDCESTVWFRWVFDCISHLGPKKWIRENEEVVA